jgi:outer membrane protein OmpA-like peptidoglycan-associated protein
MSIGVRALKVVAAKRAPSPAASTGEREVESAVTALKRRAPVSVETVNTPDVQRQPTPAAAQPHLDLGEGLAESATPFMAATIGSVIIDGFITGQSDVSSVNEAKLAGTARIIQTLLKKYAGATVRIVGQTDAVGAEIANQTLGQARADSVQRVLAHLGIPAEIIQTESKGETQLLIKTGGPEARNRRVEVRFEPGSVRSSTLLPGSLQAPSDATTNAAPAPNLRLPPGYGSPDPGPSFPPWMWKDLPEGKKRPGTSADDKLNEVAGKITSFLPKSIRGKARELVKDAIEKGITSGLDASLQGAGVDDKGRQAIGKAVDTALKQKFGGDQ